jgi:hypothetical protein
MKVSHELPLSLLHHGYEWNDYDYCLPHLIDKHEQYRLYFQKARLNKRFIIMDNGLFEGVTHTTEDLISKTYLIHPDIFIVPDAWNDSTTTVRNAKHWMLNYQSFLPVDTNLMAVCQGETIGELVTTYQTLVDLGYTHIAFNHSSIAYTNYYPNHSKLFAQMYGRIELIRRLVETGTVRTSLYHHMLGASNWKEFQAYTEFDWIKSVDTSAPIINGALGIKFNHDEPYNKPAEKLEDIMEMDLSDKMDIIQHNVDIFRESIK